jgi:HAD superfamily hydrolase (TIGR01509 family)
MTTMNIKCILFDSDGVIAETDRIYFEINSQLILRHGIKHTREDYIQYSFLSDLGSAGFLKENNIENINDFKFERNQMFIRKISTIKPIASSTVDAISELSKKYKIGIVTNASSEVLTAVYKSSVLLDYIDLVVSREKYTNPKPAPDCYLKAIQELDIPPDQTIVVEDSPRGIAAAKSAGLKTVHFQNKYFPEVTADADFKISEISELIMILES